MSKGETQYLVTFAAGIAAFWLAGQVALHISLRPIALAATARFITTLAIYGLIMAALAWLLYGRARTLKAVLIAAITAIILTALGAELLLHVVLQMIVGHAKASQQLGLFSFIAYLLYGLFFATAAAFGRRFTTR